MKLERHQALVYKKTLAGQTHPYLVQIDAEKAAVVKLICQHGCVCLKEYLAICMARVLRLNTLTPIQVSISRDFVEELPQNSSYAHAFSRHAAPAFGTYYETGLVTPEPEVLGSPDLRKELLTIFCFDLLIRNFDRLLRNPNLLEKHQGKQTQIWVIDHEAAFPYSLDATDGGLWTLSTEEYFKIQGHCTYQPLRAAFKLEYAWCSQAVYQVVQTFKTAFAFDSPFWDQVWQATPLPWRNKDEYAKIKSHISAVGEHSTEMVEMIREVLSR